MIDDGNNHLKIDPYWMMMKLTFPNEIVFLLMEVSLVESFTLG